ncbi:MAG: 4-(cytidine 5'-diphospho)-2-C-methyl-D-erythritol kinase [Chlamydiae bacterium]|nr:4-(cytidine 5'-diphospho)-2-C-methyl-D-erythritol kinase [Chlamydiota bacterium]
MRWFSPAKVNIFFRTLAKRGDGYHEIASLYIALDFGDYLDIEFSDQDQFTSNHPRLKQDSTNLVIRALDLFRDRLGNHAPVKIHLDKQIPFESGLGGGSSNAATTLFGLNSLFGNPFSIDELRRMGALLGSDVAFFFSSGAAYCTGRGDVVENVHFTSSETFWVALPHLMACSTAKIYSICKENEMSSKDPRDLLEDALSNTLEPVNDLMPAAFRLNPLLEVVYKDLKKVFSQVIMTGSGSAFWAKHKRSQDLPESCMFIACEQIKKDQDGWYSPSIKTYLV